MRIWNINLFFIQSLLSSSPRLLSASLTLLQNNLSVFQLFSWATTWLDVAVANILLIQFSLVPKLVPNGLNTVFLRCHDFSDDQCKQQYHLFPPIVYHIFYFFHYDGMFLSAQAASLEICCFFIIFQCLLFLQPTDNNCLTQIFLFLPCENAASYLHFLIYWSECGHTSSRSMNQIAVMIFSYWLMLRVEYVTSAQLMTPASGCLW